MQMREFQKLNCVGCKWADTKALKAHKACCTKSVVLIGGNNICIRRNRYQDEVDILIMTAEMRAAK